MKRRNWEAASNRRWTWCASARLGRQGGGIRGFAQAGFGEAEAAGVVVQDPVLRAGPHRIGLHHARTAHLQEQSARPAGALDHTLMPDRLLRIQAIVRTERLQ